MQNFYQPQTRNPPIQVQMDIIKTMMREEPVVRACVQRISQAVSCKEIQLKENNKPVAQQLIKHFSSFLPNFLRNCVEMCYACGFVAFTIKRRSKLPVFETLPLGTFTWCVRDGQPSEDLLVYDVKYKNGRVSDESIVVVPYAAATMSLDGSTHSPMMHMASMWLAKIHQFEQVQHAEIWNREKHIAVTEKIELKDQTTSGLQLLDDVRRYSLTGRHHSIVNSSSMRARSRLNDTIDSASEGVWQWCKDTFRDQQDPTNSVANVHLMPPNTEIHELNNLESSPMLQLMIETFQNEIYAFFDLPGMNQLSSSKASGVSDVMSRQQYANIQHMTSFLQQVIELGYGKAFDTAVALVECKLTPLPRLELKEIADLKVLTEVGILNPQDKMRIRGIFME